MTYAELRDFLREQLIVDDTAGLSDGFYTADELLEYLQIAARELGALVGYPIRGISQEIPEGRGTIALATAGVLRIVPHSVAFEGFSLTPAPYAQVKQYQSYTGLGQPRYYHFEPSSNQRTLELGPTPRSTGLLTLQAVGTYEPPSDLNTEVWNGMYGPYHRIVAYRAARMAFEAAPGEEERSQLMAQREREMLQEFLIHTGNVNLPEQAKVGGQ